MRLELFKEPRHIPIPYVHDRHSTIIHMGNYGEHPIYILKTVQRSGVAQCGRHGEIFINDEVYDLFQKSPEGERFLETVCEHEVRHYNHESRARTNEELEVLKFLRKQGID